MKVLRMNLIAYGPFTEKSLDLSDGNEGVHIVYGPNEAGKSSALRALRHLLYGIPTRSPDNFIHPYPNMRLGGTLRRRDGAQLDFIRRKGHAKTLRTPDDADVLEESDLHAFLDGVDSEMFSTMFGIDHADLIRGGEEILRGKGDIGQILFSAGSGIMDLRKVQDELQAEADALFKPSAQKPRINDAIALLKEKQKEIREAQLPSEEWLKHNDALAAVQIRKEEVEKALEEKRREKHRLERISEALPLIAKQKDLLESLKEYGDAPILSPDFGRRWQEAFTLLKVAEEKESRAESSLNEARQASSELKVPESLIEHADQVERLYKELGSYQKSMKDRVRLVADRNHLREDAAAILRGLRPDLTLEQAEEVRLTKTQELYISDLGAKYERLLATIENSSEEITKLKSRIERLQEEMEAHNNLPDPAQLRMTAESIRQQGPLEEQMRSELGEIERSEKNLQISLENQRLWTGSLEELEKLSLPMMETINAFEEHFSECTARVDKHQDEIETIDEKLLELEGQMEQLRLEQEVPTEGDLESARIERQKGWGLVRQSWLDGVEPGETARDFISLFPVTGDLAGAYELSVQNADDLADRLRRESDRVARKATLLANRETLINRRNRSRELLESATTALEKWTADWAELWGALSVHPRSPREMRVWTQAQRTIAEQFASLKLRKAKAGELQEKISGYREDLLRCLDEIGVSKREGYHTLSQLLKQAQVIIDRLSEKKSNMEKLSMQREQSVTALREAESQRAKAISDMSSWRAQWAVAVKSIGLDAGSTPAQANLMLNEQKELFEKIRGSEGYASRIRGIDRDARNFEEAVKVLVIRIAPDLGTMAAEGAAMELNARLNRAREVKAQAESLKKRTADEQGRLEMVREEMSRIKAQLSTMCEEACCKTFDELPAAEKRSIGKLEVQANLQQLEERLRGISAGMPLGEFIKDAQSVNPDTLPLHIMRLEEEIGPLETERTQLYQAIGQERAELSRMDGSSRAAELAQEAQGILARMEMDAEQFVRLKLSASILGRAIENYREKNQGPIMKRASELFARLTCGSLDSLRMDFTDKGDPVLVGVRNAGKEIVQVEGMSDGTADQLYLSVRLASLEAYLQKKEPMPFIIDDILIRFDDDRSVAALQILAEVSRHTQVIFFTHHRHLLDLARSCIRDENLFVHSLVQ